MDRSNVTVSNTTCRGRRVLSSIIFGVAQALFLSEVASPSAILDAANQANAGLQAGPTMEDFANMPLFGVLLSMNWGMMISMFIIFFIGGYLLYGSLFAAVGAAVDSETDTQQFMLPITLPMVFGLLLSEFLMMNPEGTMGTIFSIVPFTSPVVIMLKSAMWDGDGIWSKVFRPAMSVITIPTVHLTIQ